MTSLNVDSVNFPTNPKLPTWNGQDGQQGLEQYTNILLMHFAGTKPEERERLGPQYWSNLRGEAFLAEAAQGAREDP